MSTLDSYPSAADFATPPTGADRARWSAADRASRPARLTRLRARMAAAGVDAYLGLRPEHSRYLTGFVLGDGEEKVAGYSGWFVVGTEDLIVFADSRYTIQVGREAPDARIEPVYGDLRQRWPEIAAGLGGRTVAVEASHLSHAAWTSLAESAPDVTLVPASEAAEDDEPGPGWVEADRATKEPAELERVAAACAVADRALAALLPEIRPGVTEAELAWRLEVLIRTGGADGLAFDVACLA